ncbi:type I toxin-antitoxin system Hok family toxin [Escherichia coli]|nr:type I toxin-antitoxin system Hok family toxin [Escherichia coli]EFA7762864.1 type I toxin-antitoxin system Hok family toxin [Escherichia coli]EFA7788726.1 type I toxin-antitoxin system Hok family toxin [Escherichia coli]EFA7793650.1 type I toxin-antitoxin system Hok family toxin [Escherichia coli]EFA7798726.1 type I toxin-antitoxin system Hok family toxin [Escherichia coli]
MPVNTALAVRLPLIELLAECATVLCFSLIFRERLYELNIHRGNTVVQVTLAYEARK